MKRSNKTIETIVAKILASLIIGILFAGWVILMLFSAIGIKTLLESLLGI